MRAWLVIVAAGMLAGCAWIEGEAAPEAAAPAVAPAGDELRLECERQARAEHPGITIGDAAIGNRYAQRRYVESCLKQHGQPLQ